MKRIFLVLSLGSALILSQSAFADSRHYNRGYTGWGYGNSYGPGYKRDYNRSYNRYPFYRPYGYRGGNYRGYNYRGGNYVNFSYRNYYSRNTYSHNYGPRYYADYGYHRYDHRHYDAGDIVGGIVLGSLISSSLNRYRDSRDYERVVYRSRPVSRSRDVVVVNRTGSTAPSGRRLLRDLQGRCYEITTSSVGDEVRTELDRSVCNY